MAVHFEYKGQHFELPDGTTPDVAITKIKAHLGEETSTPQEASKPDLPLLTKAAIAVQEGAQEVLPAIDLALGLPTFIAKIGAQGAMDIGAAFSGEEKPLEKSSAIMEKAMEAPWMKAMSAPLSYAAGKDLSEGTMVGKVMGKVSEKVGEAAKAVSEETDNPELGQVVKRAADIAMLKGGEVAIGAAKGVSTLWKKRQELKKLSAEERSKEVEKVVEEHPEYTSEQINSFLDAPEDAHINAKKLAQNLIDSGVSADKLATIVEKKPLVKVYLDEYAARYAALQEATSGGRLAADVAQKQKKAREEADKAERDRVLQAAAASRGAPSIGETPSSFASLKGEEGKQAIFSYTGGTTLPYVPRKTVNNPSGEVYPLPKTTPREDVLADTKAAQQEIEASVPPEELAKLPATPALTPVENAGIIKQAINKVGEDVGSLADVAFGTLSTRLHNVSPELGRRAQDVELNIKTDTHQSITGADKALSFIEKDAPSIIEGIKGKFSPEALKVKQAAFDKVKSQWLNQDRAGLKVLVEASKDADTIAAFDHMTASLDKVGEALQSRGLANTRESYLPRIVKDRKGLLESLGFTMKSQLEKALAKKAESQGTTVAQLDPTSYSEVVNQFLRKSVPAGSGKAGLTKGRVFQDISPEMQKYYYDPVETYHTYMERAWSEVHTADFFGKSKVVKDGKIDVDVSIGNYLNKLVEEGKMEPPGSPKWEEAAKVLETRFKYGHLVPKETIQNINNISTVFTIANGLSALSNISDIASAPFYYGLKPAMQAVAQKLSGKQQYNVKDFGLADHISEEFIGRSATQRLADNAMTLSLWKILDPMGKNIQFNSSLIRGQNWAKTPEGLKKLQERYGDAYGEDFPKLVADLAARKDSFLTRSMVMWDVAQHQPLTKLQKSEMITKSPNAAGMMMKLKSFMMMQADFARRNAYNEIKAGHYQKGFKALMLIAGAWATVGVSQKAIKNFILGKDEDIKQADIVAGMLGQVGFNQYAYDTMAQGKPAAALGMMFAPPAVGALGTGWTDEASMARKVPVIGPWLSQAYKEDKARQDAIKKALK